MFILTVHRVPSVLIVLVSSVNRRSLSAKSTCPFVLIVGWSISPSVIMRPLSALSAWLCALLLLFSSACCSGQLLVNSTYGFETPVVTTILYGASFTNPAGPSTSAGYTPFTFNSLSGISRPVAGLPGGTIENTDRTAVDGSQYAFLQSYYGPTGIATMTTSIVGMTPNNSYTLTFWYSLRDPTSNSTAAHTVQNLSLSVSLDKQLLFAAIFNVDVPDFLQVQRSFLFTNASALLNFTVVAPGGDQSVLIDSVSVVPSSAVIVFSAPTINLSTGLGINNRVIQLGAVADRHWVVLNASAQTVYPGNADFASDWVANNALSAWVSVNALSSHPAPCPYTFYNNFSMAAFNVSTVVISGSWAVDNLGTLSLNGNVLQTLTAASSWTTLHAFSVTAAQGIFNLGMNSLSITLNCDDSTDGIRVQATLTGAVPTYPPSSSSSSTSSPRASSSPFSSFLSSSSPSTSLASSSAGQLPLNMSYGFETPVVSSYLYSISFPNPSGPNTSSSYTPFAFSGSAGIARPLTGTLLTFENTAHSTGDGVQYAFLQTGGVTNISTFITGMEVGHSYSLSFSYCTRDPSVPSGTVIKGLWLNATLDNQLLFAVDINANIPTFVSVNQRFVFTNTSSQLIFAASAGSDQTVLLDSVIVVASSSMSSSSSSSSSSSGGTLSVPGRLNFSLSSSGGTSSAPSVNCSSLLFGPFSVSSLLNLPAPEYPAQDGPAPGQPGTHYADLATGVLFSAPGTLQISDVGDNSTLICHNTTTSDCSGPAGRPNELLFGFPVTALLFRLAQAPATLSTNVSEYQVAFNQSLVGVHAITNASSTFTQQLYLAINDDYWADNSGVLQHVLVEFTPANCAVNSQLSSSLSPVYSSSPSSSSRSLSSSGSSSVFHSSFSSSSSSSSSASASLTCSATYTIDMSASAVSIDVQWPACASDVYSFSSSANVTRLWSMGGITTTGTFLTAVYASTNGFGSVITSSLQGSGTLYAGAAYLANRNLLYVSGKYNQNGLASSFSTQVLVSTDQGATFTVSTSSIPFTPRSDVCATAIPNTNVAIVCGGQGYVAGSGVVTLVDCWMSADGRGANWTQQIAVGPSGIGSSAPCIGLFDAQPSTNVNGTFVLTSSTSALYFVSTDYAHTFITLSAPWPSNGAFYSQMATDMDSYIYLSNYLTSVLWLSVDQAHTWSKIAVSPSSAVSYTSQNFAACLGLSYTHNIMTGAVTGKRLVIYGGVLSAGGGSPFSIQGSLQFNCTGTAVLPSSSLPSSSSLSSSSSTAPPAPVGVQFSFCADAGTANPAYGVQTPSTSRTLVSGVLTTTALLYTAGATYSVSSVNATYALSSSNVTYPAQLTALNAVSFCNENGCGGFYLPYDNRFTLSTTSSTVSIPVGLAFSSSLSSLLLSTQQLVECTLAGSCGTYGTLSVQLYNASNPTAVISCAPISATVQFSFCFETGTINPSIGNQTSASFRTAFSGILSTTALVYSPTGTYVMSSISNGSFVSSTLGNSSTVVVVPPGSISFCNENGCGGSYIPYDNTFTVQIGTSQVVYAEGLALGTAATSVVLYGSSQHVSCTAGDCASYGTFSVQFYNSSTGQILPCEAPLVSSFSSSSSSVSTSSSHSLSPSSSTSASALSSFSTLADSSVFSTSLSATSAAASSSSSGSSIGGAAIGGSSSGGADAASSSKCGDGVCDVRSECGLCATDCLSISPNTTFQGSSVVVGVVDSCVQLTYPSFDFTEAFTNGGNGSSTVVCRFGSSSMLAAGMLAGLANDPVILCLSPPLLLPGTYSMEYSLDSGDSFVAFPTCSTTAVALTSAPLAFTVLPALSPWNASFVFLSYNTTLDPVLVRTGGFQAGDDVLITWQMPVDSAATVVDIYIRGMYPVYHQPGNITNDTSDASDTLSISSSTPAFESYMALVASAVPAAAGQYVWNVTSLPDMHTRLIGLVIAPGAASSFHTMSRRGSDDSEIVDNVAVHSFAVRQFAPDPVVCQNNQEIPSQQCPVTISPVSAPPTYPAPPPLPLPSDETEESNPLTSVKFWTEQAEKALGAVAKLKSTSKELKEYLERAESITHAVSVALDVPGIAANFVRSLESLVASLHNYHTTPVGLSVMRLVAVEVQLVTTLAPEPRGAAWLNYYSQLAGFEGYAQVLEKAESLPNQCYGAYCAGPYPAVCVTASEGLTPLKAVCYTNAIGLKVCPFITPAQQAQQALMGESDYVDQTVAPLSGLDSLCKERSYCNANYLYSMASDQDDTSCNQLFCQQIATQTQRMNQCADDPDVTDGLIFSNCIKAAAVFHKQCGDNDNDQETTDNPTLPPNTDVANVTTATDGAMQMASTGVAGSTGDPHYITWDGLHFNFMGQGVFWYLWDTRASVGVQLQVTLVVVPQWNPNVTVTGALALRNFHGQSIVVLQPTTGPSILLYVDGLQVRFPALSNSSYAVEPLCAPTYRFNGGVVTVLHEALFNVELDGGYTVSVSAGYIAGVAYLSSVQAQAPASAFNNTRGLLGTWTDSIRDELVDWNGVDWGASSPLGFSDEALFNFGQQLVVAPQDTFFVYAMRGRNLLIQLQLDDPTANTTLLVPASSSISGGQAMNSTVAVPPAVWGNVSRQAAADLLCRQFTLVTSTDYVDCLYDEYYVGQAAPDIAAGYSGAAITRAVLSVYPLRLSLLNATYRSLLVQANLPAAVCSSLLSAVPAASSYNPSTVAAGASWCVPSIEMLDADNGRWWLAPVAAINGTTVNSLQLTLTVLLPMLSPSTVYSLRTSFLYPGILAFTDTSRAVVLLTSALLYASFATLGCLPLCVDNGFLPCGGDGCGGTCGGCPSPLLCSDNSALLHDVPYLSSINRSTSVSTATAPYSCAAPDSFLTPAFILSTLLNGSSGGSSTGGSLGPTSTGMAAIRGDPQFLGLRGQYYQVHGIDGAVYNIISETDTQVNARFVFLSQGQCPVIDGFPDSNCWSHPGSYVGELSFQQVVSGSNHAAFLTAGSANKGFSQVQVDGQALQVGQRAAFGSFSVTRKSAFAVSVTTAHFAFELTNSDRFINQAVILAVPLSQLEGAHGLLGQTHSAKVYRSPVRYIEGEVDDYTIAEGDLFGSSFLYNRFLGAQGTATSSKE